MTWGLLDTMTGLWVGDYAGITTFDSMMRAAEAGVALSRRLGYATGRLIAKEVLETPGPERMRELFKTVGVELREGTWPN